MLQMIIQRPVNTLNVILARAYLHTEHLGIRAQPSNKDLDLLLGGLRHLVGVLIAEQNCDSIFFGVLCSKSARGVS